MKQQSEDCWRLTPSASITESRVSGHTLWYFQFSTGSYRLVSECSTQLCVCLVSWREAMCVESYVVFINAHDLLCNNEGYIHLIFILHVVLSALMRQYFSSLGAVFSRDAANLQASYSVGIHSAGKYSVERPPLGACISANVPHLHSLSIQLKSADYLYDDALRGGLTSDRYHCRPVSNHCCQDTWTHGPSFNRSREHS